MATVGGFPVLSTDLQWGITSLSSCWVSWLRCSSASNLMGARHGADIVATKLGVNADAKTGKVGGVYPYTNIFSALAGESTGEEESTESDDSETEEDE
eukprot:COSAG06_NODE_23834_length_680_cov_1.075731_1_plen_98_part_00